MTGKEAIDISPNKDQGVLKKILIEGVEDETPPNGCQVFVHYVGTLLDGTKFDSSRDRNEPFKFNLGKGQVIKGWDISVATMKKKEKALVTCKPEYAYGINGSPPKIPSNATLNFEIEVLCWKGEDLSLEKDGSIERILITKSEKSKCPKDGSFVKVHLEGYINENGSQGAKFDDRDEEFILGEGLDQNICPGLERALQYIKEGETSKLFIKHKHIRPVNLNVPKKKDVIYIVTLHSFEKGLETWKLDSAEKLEQARINKEKGTNYFKKGNYELAVKMYQKIKELIEFLPEKEGEYAEKRKELLLSCFLNLGLCYMKTKKWVECKDACTEALKIQDNAKAYFRRGMAYAGLADFDLAINDFNKVLSIEGQNQAAQAQIVYCKQKITEHKNKEKQIYANMFEKFANKDSKKEEEIKRQQPDVMSGVLGEWGQDERERAGMGEPTKFEKENPNILMLNNDGEFKNM